MDQPETGNIQSTIFLDIQKLLERCAGLEEKQIQLSLDGLDLAKKRTADTSNLIPLISSTTQNTEKQTGMAQERTSLTREQTRSWQRTDVYGGTKNRPRRTALRSGAQTHFAR